MGKLGVYLRGAGLITGPSSVVTRHTHLGAIKTILQGSHVKAGSHVIKKSFQSFGTVLHARFLQPNLKGKELSEVNKLWKTLNIVDKRKISGMLEALKKHPVAQSLINKAECEKTRRRVFYGINFQFTPDAVKIKKIGSDLKSSACTDQDDFISKAFGYGYFRQGVTYMEASSPKLKEFYIIGISKTYPHPIFIVDILEHKEFVSYAKQELNFLLYFYKHYGNFKELERAQEKPKTKRNQGTPARTKIIRGKSSFSKKKVRTA